MFTSKKALSPVFSVFMIMTLLVQQSLIVRADEQVELFEAGELTTEQIKGFEELKDEGKPEIKVLEIVNPVPAVEQGGVGTIDLVSIIFNGTDYEASGTWQPAGNNCWNPGNDFQFRIDLIDQTANQSLNIVTPAPCNGDFVDPVSNGDKGTGGIWPAIGQSGNTFTLTTAGTHSICAVLRHANGQGNDIASDCQDVVIEGEQCIPDLDYVNGQGGGPDGQLTLGDAVIFTQRYVQAMHDHVYDATVDANRNSINDTSDYTCAVAYYGTASAPICPLQCERPVGTNTVTGDICNSPLDYNSQQGVLGADGNLSLSDAVEFTKRYEAAKGSQSGDGNYNLSVDVNFDGKVTVADYFCAQPYYGNAGPYTCQLDCAKACVNPIDYNEDYEITLSDATTFTIYYGSNDLRADLNQNGVADYGDYNCSLDQIAMADYQCPIQCAPTCGDKTLTRRTGEQCDDGNRTDGDGCSSTCKIETECNEEVADYNNDGVITLADAVLFTPFYLAEQAEGDIDVNGETRLHDKICMDGFLNQPVIVPVITDVPGPLGVPPMLKVSDEDNQPNFGGSASNSNGTYQDYGLEIPVIDNKPVFPGKIVTITEPVAPKILGLSTPTKSNSSAKEVPAKGKRPTLLVVAPAAKNEAILQDAPAVSASQPVDTTDSDTGIIGKILNFFSGLFN